MSNENQWITIAEAAAETRLPLRTIYNWAKSGSITSQKEDGTTSVLLPEVRAKAREREATAPKPALLPAASAGTQPPATDAGTNADRFLEVLPQEARAAVPLEILAHLIRLFEQGVPLQSIVEQLRLPPLLTIEAKRQYDLLVNAGGQPSVIERLSTMEERMDRRLGAMEARISQAKEEHRAAIAHTLNELWGSFESQIRQVKHEINLTREQSAHASKLMNLHINLQQKAFTEFTEGVLSLFKTLRR